jgi:hypothetical protein
MALKIFDEAYIGLQKRQKSVNETKDLLPLGFMVPNGTDSGALKRKATVDDWANSNYYGQKNNTIEPIIIPNLPTYGFKFHGGIRTSSQGGETHFRLEDPRGFELEIKASNVAFLLTFTTFHNGEILEECVWMRDGSSNWLIPIKSDEYKEALAMHSKLTTDKISFKDVKPGFKVTLHNGLMGTYLGSHYPVTNSSRYYDDKEFIKFPDKKHFFLCMEKIDGIDREGKTPIIRTVSSPKVISIDERIENSIQDCENIINEHIYNDGYFGGAKIDGYGCYEYTNDIIFVSNSKISFQDIKMDIRTLSEFKSTKTQRLTRLLSSGNDTYWQNGSNILLIDRNKLLKNELYTLNKFSNESYYKNNSYRYTGVQYLDTFDFDKRCLVINIKLKSGNELKDRLI